MGLDPQISIGVNSPDLKTLHSHEWIKVMEDANEDFVRKSGGLGYGAFL